MPDTTTPVLGLVKQTIGGNRNTWGGILNACMDLIEGAFYGQTSMVVTGAGDVTLTDAQRRKRVLNFTGTLADDQIVIVANLVGRWTVNNATTGAFTLSMKTATGDPVVIPQGGHCSVWCDGDDVIYAGLSTRLRDTQMLAPDGTLGAPGLSFATELDSGWRRVSSKVFAFIINGIQRIRVEAAVFKVTLGTAIDVISSTDEAMTIGVPVDVAGLTVNGESVVPVGGTIAYDGITEPNGWKFKNGQAISRATYALLLAALTATANATANGTDTLSSVDVDLTGLGLEGAKIEGSADIATNTTILSITSNSIVMSQAATGSGSISIRILPHGNGDGSTTFNVPDDRGRTIVGRDNMGATSANRLTGQSGGLDGDKLGNAGGEETHTLITGEMPSHTHTATVTDPGHTHTFHYAGSATGDNATLTGVPTTRESGTVPFGGGSNAGTATISINNDTTGISVSNASQGSGNAHNVVQPSRVANKIIFTGVFA